MKIFDIKVADLVPYANNPIGGVLFAETARRKYFVTRKGEIYTQNKMGEWHKCRARKQTNGYLRVSIDKKDKYIHRIVASIFVKNPNNYSEVNHKDGDKTNNCVANLEWCNRSQNNKHAFATGLRNYDELKQIARMPKLSMRKLTRGQIQEILKITNISHTAIAKRYGVSRQLIDKVFSTNGNFYTSFNVA